MEIDWDRRYREGFYGNAHETHELVRKFAPLMPANKPVIDIAMGTGRDLAFLGALGFPLVGLERSWEAIKQARQNMEKKGFGMHNVFGDARSLPFKPGRAGAVLVFYFLLREIMGELAGLLAPGGILVYETFLKRQNEIDRPRNPAYLLDDGELISYFGSLELLFYEEGVFGAAGKRRAIARYAGRKRSS